MSYVCSNGQIHGGDLTKFCGLLRIYTNFRKNNAPAHNILRKYFNPLLIVLFRRKKDNIIFYLITYYKEGEKEDVKLTDEKTNFLPPRQLANP